MRRTTIETHGFIYKFTNKVNGKVYVGKSVKSAANCIQRHFWNATIRGKKTKLYDAIREHGFQNFEFKIIYDNIPKDLLDIAELCAIYVHDTVDNGYNSTLGGTGNDTKTYRQK